jgi:hypothetical protein
MLEPFLFSSDRRLVTDLADGLVAAVVVDWEHRGKAARQANAVERIGSDTQINADGPDDLAAVVAIASVPVLCRVNAWTSASPDEIDLAVACGASEVIVPMVRDSDEVEAALEAAAGRIGVGIMVETVEAVSAAPRLAALPITRTYVGLMDLALERGSPSIFDAFADGTVERLRAVFDAPFGVAGLTIPTAGSPIPARALAGELVRLRCAFSFLRRSFIRDSGSAPADGVRSIRRMIGDLEARTIDAVERDHLALLRRLGDAAHDRRTVST